MMIVPGIYKVVGNRGCNSYVVESNAGLLIIDVGYLGSEHAILRYLDAQLGASPEDVAYIIITHARRNCAEAAVDLLTYCDEAKLIVHADDFNTFKRITLLTSPENVEIIKNEKRNIENIFDILHTPGYTPGSITVKFGDSLFIGGLVYVDHTQRIAFPKQTYDKKLLMESLNNILELDFSNIFPSHGRYILRDAKKKLKEFATQ